MVSLTALALPIFLSAVLVFLASSVIHMVLRYHKNDLSPFPGSSATLDALRKDAVPPGDYVFPCPRTMKDLKSPEFLKQYEQGPVGVLTLMRNAPPSMGASLGQWFVYCLALGVLVAYVTGRTVGPDAEYLRVFRVAGAAAFLGFSGAHPVDSIWHKRKWSTTWKHVFDGLVYALIVAGCFAGFWPR